MRLAVAGKKFIIYATIYTGVISHTNDIIYRQGMKSVKHATPLYRENVLSLFPHLLKT